MKLIQINASYKPAFIYGGPTMSVSKLSEVLVSKRLTLEVLTTTADGEKELKVETNKTIIIDSVPVSYYKRLTRDHTHFSPSLLITLWRKLPNTTNQKAADLLIHIHAWWNLVSVLSCLIAILKKTPVVLSPRGTLSTYSFANRNNFLKKVIYTLSVPLLKRCHFHATSENEKNALLRLITPKSIFVIPNLVTLPQNPSAEAFVKAPSTTIDLLFFSRVEQKKGLELLFVALTNCDFQYHLTIAGPGDEIYIQQLKVRSESLGINRHISWIGNQRPENKFDIMAEHEILLLPSHDENFANVVIESLASGTAVIITENVGLSDYVLKNDFGWVCKFDENDLSLKLQAAAADKAKLNMIRQKAPDKIRADFSDNKIVDQYIAMYNSILNHV